MCVCVCDIMSCVTLCVTIFRMRLCSWGGRSLCYDKAPPFSPSASQLPKREPPAPPLPSPPAAVTEHIGAAGARGVGVGGGQAAAIVLRVPSPPPSPSSPTPTGLPSPLHQQTKAPQPPTRRSPLPPRRSSPACSLPAPACAAPSSAPPLAGRRSAGTSGAAGPGAASRAPPCRSGRGVAFWGGGPGQGLRIGGLPLGAAEHTAAREGGHREIGKRGPERVRHDPAAATWWQVRQRRRRRRGERARGAEAAAAAGREGGGAGGRAAAARREGALLDTARLAPPPRALRPRPGREAAASPAALPRAHLLLFRGKGRSFWKAKGQKDGGQRGPSAATREPLSAPWRSGSGVGPVPHHHGHLHPWPGAEDQAPWGRGYQGDSFPDPHRSAQSPL